MQNVRQSFERARSANFAARFYESLLASDAGVRRKFQKTNFERQRELLVHGVRSMLDYAEGKAIGKMAMERLANLHDARHLDIPPAMYQRWMKAFVETLREVDPQFDAALEAEWRAALQPAVDLMVQVHQASLAKR